MGELIGGTVGVLVVVGAVALMVRSWRRRSRRDADLAAYPVPTGLGEPQVEVEALYVATTPAGTPLERLALAGLAFRGAAHVEVHREGVLLRIVGEQPSFIPAATLVGIGTASYAIDRAVEPEGLVAVTWTPDRPVRAGRAPGATGTSDTSGTSDASAATGAVDSPTHVDSYLRARYPGDAARLIAAVTELAAGASASRPDPKERGTND